MRLAVDSVSVRRGGRVIFDGVSLDVAAGEIVGVVGPNGCGKSTLIQAIAGVIEPRAGHVRVEGQSVWGSRRARQAARRQLGYVPEGADAPGFLTGGELWALCRSARGGELDARVREGLGLDDLEAKRLETMSLGQRRRACLGAAFVGSPPLLVLDEPDNGLDVARLDALVGLVRAHAASGGATLLASHDAGWLEALGARRFAIGQAP